MSDSVMMQWKAINGASLLTGLPTALNTALHYDLLLCLVAFEPETKHPVTYTHYNPEGGSLSNSWHLSFVLCDNKWNPTLFFGPGFLKFVSKLIYVSSRNIALPLGSVISISYQSLKAALWTPGD